jgi:hypothetical protein
MKKAIALGITAAAMSIAGRALAVDCNAVNSLLNQGHSIGEVAAAAGISVTDVDACWRRGAAALNPAGPPPVNAAGPPPMNAAGPPPVNAAGPAPRNAAGSAPKQPWGAPPMNPAGIPR